MYEPLYNKHREQVLASDYIQVDEFQDVSLREVELVGILSNKCGNLFVVGDDSQCIYSFRGSDVNCIIKFKEIMDKVQNRDNDVVSVYLTTNYRSTPEILNVRGKIGPFGRTQKWNVLDTATLPTELQNIDTSTWQPIIVK